ncbi:MAG: SPFH domain-containing protein [Chloroflexi bacterium]|nr:SPFH domain-containing protein [Chloroflexota bacterium]MBI5712500.1 SPFH domain-containing protein [Chloroflexota bacterium]
MSGVLYLALLIGIAVLGMLFMLTSLRKIPDNSRGVVFRFGRLLRELEPGTRWVIPLIDQVMLVNLDEQTFQLPSGLTVSDSSGEYEVWGRFTCKIIDATPAVIAAMQTQQPIEQTVGDNLVMAIQEMGVQTARESKQAQGRALELLNEQMSRAWQLKFTKIEFRLKYI